ncbi:MAG TPA: hypothetical protein VLI46_03890 [Ramlibacter sp.]|nr:hypothetical protein [Ramlibacter sp.]
MDHTSCCTDAYARGQDHSTEFGAKASLRVGSERVVKQFHGSLLLCAGFLLNVSVLFVVTSLLRCRTLLHLWDAMVAHPTVARVDPSLMTPVLVLKSEPESMPKAAELGKDQCLKQEKQNDEHDLVGQGHRELESAGLKSEFHDELQQPTEVGTQPTLREFVRPSQLQNLSASKVRIANLSGMLV